MLICALCKCIRWKAQTCLAQALKIDARPPTKNKKTKSPIGKQPSGIYVIMTEIYHASLRHKFLKQFNISYDACFKVILSVLLLYKHHLGVVVNYLRLSSKGGRRSARAALSLEGRMKSDLGKKLAEHAKFLASGGKDGSRAHFTGEEFKGISFEHYSRDLSGAIFKGCTFHNCTFRQLAQIAEIDLSACSMPVQELQKIIQNFLEQEKAEICPPRPC